MINWIVNHILLLSGWTALAVIFLLPALESSIFLGFVLPGETAVVVGGVLAYNHKIALAGALIAAIAGAVVGDSVGFEVGRRWGDALLTRLPKKLVKPVHVAQGKETINRLGGRAVFAGRWVSVLRALVPGLCGTSKMKYGNFLLWNALGGVTWATGYTLLGYLAGSAWQRVEHYSSVVSYVLLGVVVVIVVAVVMWRRRVQAAKDAVTEAELAEEVVAETVIAVDTVDVEESAEPSESSDVEESTQAETSGAEPDRSTGREPAPAPEPEPARSASNSASD